MTQKEYVMNHLQTVGWITPRDAEERYSIMRLAARIADLQADGVKIKRVMQKSKNKFGKSVRYARYELEEKQ